VPKILFHITTISYTILLAIGSLAKINNQSTFNIKYEDKIVHFLAYAILCMLVFLSLTIKGINKSLLYAVLFAFIYGIVLELLQSMMTHTRVSEGLDIVANTLGILAMAVYVSRKKQVLDKKLKTFM